MKVTDKPMLNEKDQELYEMYQQDYKDDLDRLAEARFELQNSQRWIKEGQELVEKSKQKLLDFEKEHKLNNKNG